MKYLFGQTKKGKWELIRQIPLNSGKSIREEPVSQKYVELIVGVLGDTHYWMCVDILVKRGRKIYPQESSTSPIEEKNLPSEVKAWCLVLRV